MKSYEFKVNFYETYGTFYVDAKDIDDAYNKATKEISKAIKNLPVEVEYDVECVEEEK